MERGIGSHETGRELLPTRIQNSYPCFVPESMVSDKGDMMSFKSLLRLKARLFQMSIKLINGDSSYDDVELDS